MANKTGYPTTPSVLTWLQMPVTQYVPLSDVAFGPREVVLPHSLPPRAAYFPNPQANKMLNIPSAEAVYNNGRTGRIF